MQKNRKYCVAGHEFEVVFPDTLDSEKLLSSYEPFRVDETPNLLFSVTVQRGELPYVGELIEMCNDESPYIWLYKKGETINFGFSFTTDAPTSVLEFNGNSAVMTISPATRFYEANNAVGNAMMLMYAYNTVWSKTLMIHASVSVKDGLGYVFLGKSGTGKSTHSSLWMKNIPDVWLLNDDNPVIRIVDGVVRVFGTPWSGKTPCYKNLNVPVQAIVDLEQAPFNKIERLNPIGSYVALMPSCSSIKWDQSWADAENKTLEEVITGVGCWHLRCLPDAEAALLSYSTCKPQE